MKLLLVHAHITTNNVHQTATFKEVQNNLANSSVVNSKELVNYVDSVWMATLLLSIPTMQSVSGAESYSYIMHVEGSPRLYMVKHAFAHG